MRYLVCAFAVTLASVPMEAAEELNGSFRCNYIGGWGCGPGSPGICIDSGGTRGERATLEVNIDGKHIRLNGLDGYLERQNLKEEYWVLWRVAALGYPKFSILERDGTIIAKLIYERTPTAGMSISEFNCRRSR